MATGRGRNGRLKKGYRLTKGGKVVKAKAKRRSKKRRAKKRGSKKRARKRRRAPHGLTKTRRGRRIAFIF